MRPLSSSPTLTTRWWVASLSVVAGVAVTAVACSSQPLVLSAASDARHLVAQARASLAASAEASNRAVMSSAEATASRATADTRTARQALMRDLAALPAAVDALHDVGITHTFTRIQPCVDDYVRVDDDVLGLAGKGADVRSLGLLVDRTRAMVADCDTRFAQLDQALAAHRFGGTR